MRTPFCDLFEIEAPILQAAIWPATSPELVAAVGEAGAIGSLGTVFTPADAVAEDIRRVRELTDRPFVVNHVVSQLDEDAFAATLEARPAAISLALADPGPLVERAHAAGSKVIHQVHTVAQALEAAALGVDAIIAQGSEAGGQGMLGSAGTLTLTPQVVDAVAPIPVLAAGGVADGRGLAAVLAAGAAGANVGTRFLASDEAAADAEWKQAIIDADSETVLRLEEWAELFPPGEGVYPAVPRVLDTDFVAKLRAGAGRLGDRAEELRAEIASSVRRREPHRLVPFAGQTAGMIEETLPAGQIVARMVAEAEAAAARLSSAAD